MTDLTFAQKTLAAYEAADAAHAAADYNTDAAAYDAAYAAYEAAYDAAKHVWAATDKAKMAYYDLIDEIDAANTDHLYLTDEGVDYENSCHEAEGSLEFWQAMNASAREAAGHRAFEAGADINKMVGRSIF